jgi:hypothetical protein
MMEETRNRILRLLEDGYGNAQDNAVRARAAFRGQDMTMQHGASGRTRAELLEMYERDEREALAALKDFEPSWQPRKLWQKG